MLTRPQDPRRGYPQVQGRTGPKVPADEHEFRYRETRLCSTAISGTTGQPCRCPAAAGPALGALATVACPAAPHAQRTDPGGTMFARQHAQQHPGQPAIIMGDSGETVTFAEYEARCNAGARLLRAAGLRRGD